MSRPEGKAVGNPPDINAVITSWATLGAVVLALFGMLYQMMKDRLERNSTKKNLRMMLTIFLTPVKLRYHGHVIASTSTSELLSSRETALIGNLEAIFPQISVLSEGEVSGVYGILATLKSLYTPGRVELGEMKSIYSQIESLCELMGTEIPNVE